MTPLPAPTQVEVEISALVQEDVQTLTDALEDVEMEIQPVEDQTSPPPGGELIPLLPFFDPFTEYMYFRFGFTHPQGGPLYESLPSWTGVLSDKSFYGLVGNLQYRETVFSGVDLRKDLFHFVNYAVGGLDPPAALWDLNATNETKLDPSTSLVTVDEVIAHSGTLYRLLGGAHHPSWSLLVPDASVAVECLRRQLFTTHDILALFLRRGTPFILAYEGGPQVIANPANVRGGPTFPLSFAAWQQSVRELLLSPRGSLVWMLGGIYWRIALYLLDHVPLPQDLIGPGVDSATSQLTDMLYQDALTEEEIAIVIGMSPLNTRKPSNPPTLASYLPHPNVAEGTALRSSHWTPSNEEWFQTHIRGLGVGTSSPQGQNAWRKTLRGARVLHSAHRKLDSFNKAACADWLKLYI